MFFISEWSRKSSVPVLGALPRCLVRTDGLGFSLARYDLYSHDLLCSPIKVVVPMEHSPNTEMVVL